MKMLLSFSYTLLISVLIGWLYTGCSGNTNEATPQTTCRIQQYTATSKSTFYTTVNQIGYEYDPQGNLTKMLTTFDKQATSGSDKQTSLKTDIYTYNANGYVTTLNSLEKRTNLFAGKTTNEQVSITSSYSYSNDRLTGSVTRNIGAYGLNTTTTETYEYDNSGELVTKTAQSTYDYDPAVAKEIQASPTGPLRIWTYQKNQLVDYVEKYGTSETRLLTLQNGLVTKITITGGYESTYEYDSQRRVIKTDEFINNTLNRSYTQTWSTAQPSSATTPVFKGWPATMQEYGQAGVLLTNNSFYLNTSTRKMEAYSAQNSVNQTNNQGFITSNVITVKFPNSVAQDYTTTETYTYTGCQ